MKIDTDGLPWTALPEFLSQTQLLCRQMQEMDSVALKQLWKCNDTIASLNIHRLKGMDLRKNLTPAILAYEGIQYQYMAPHVFTDDAFAYIQEHLRILSGFYGLLRPFDGVTPYRLEMQAKLQPAGKKNLYDFWGDTLAKRIFADTDQVINLASKEYSQCIARYVPESARFITCMFGEEHNGKIIEKGTLCKMARGEMVRWMAELQIKHPEDLHNFSRLQYRYDPKHSDQSTHVFILQKPKME